MIRQAKTTDSESLTKISFESKGYWNYPNEFFDTWSKELTITPEYIKNNDVHIFENEGVIIGYYSIIELKEDIEISGIKLKKGYWLDHMFIEPQSIRKGIGTKLFNHMLDRRNKRGITELGILADPNAKEFYEKMGCKYQGEYPSSIANRTTPWLLLKTQLSGLD